MRPFMLAAEKAGRSDVAAESEIMRATLDRIINEELTKREAEKLHVIVTDADVEAAMESVTKSAKLADRAALLREVENQGIDEGTYRYDLRMELLGSKVLQIVNARHPFQVSDQEIDARLAELKKQNPDAARDVAKEAVTIDKWERVRKDWVAKARSETYIEVRL